MRRTLTLLVALLLAAPTAAACGRSGTPQGSRSGASTSAAAPPRTTTSGPSAGTTRGPSAGTPAPTRTGVVPSTPGRTGGSPPFPASLAGKDVERIPTGRAVVALTFDAGANADAVPAILGTLVREHVPATFFLTGDFVNGFPQAARSIAGAGHRIGNHSVDHPNFTTLTDARIRAEVLDAGRMIRSVTGADPQPLFRFPLGARDTRTIAAVNAAGYVAVRWTVDSLGWQGTMRGTRGAAFVTARVLAAATPGEIVLMHVGSNPDDHSTLDAAALPGIIAGLRQRGYGFVTLDALLT